VEHRGVVLGKVGLLGGTFDPVHMGHLDVGRRILDRFSIEKLLFVPAGQNPHKGEQPKAAAEHRLEMIRLALKQVAQPRFDVLEAEINRQGKSYSIVTLQQLLKLHPDVEFTYVMGSDVFSSFGDWHRATEIMKLANIVVVTRQSEQTVSIESTLKRLGVPFGQVLEKTKRVLPFNGPHWIEVFPIKALPYSSSEIRRLISHPPEPSGSTRCPDGLQQCVWRYIKEKNLYAVS